jgi:hypothetical protein
MPLRAWPAKRKRFTRHRHERNRIQRQGSMPGSWRRFNAPRLSHFAGRRGGGDRHVDEPTLGRRGAGRHRRAHALLRSDSPARRALAGQRRRTPLPNGAAGRTAAASAEAVSGGAFAGVAARASWSSFSHVFTGNSIGLRARSPGAASVRAYWLTTSASCSRPIGPCGFNAGRGTTRPACRACAICFSVSICRLHDLCLAPK